MAALTAVGLRPDRRHRWSVPDVLRMAAAGVLGPADRVELIDGELVDKVVIGGPHVSAVNRINELLVLASARRWTVSVQNPVVLDDRSMPEPDLALLRRAAGGRRAVPRVEDVLLLIEVGDSSARADRRRKVPVYARAGVPELWLVDLVDDVLVRHAGPGPAGYASVEVLTEGVLAPSLAPELRLSVADLLDR